jgi:hypothetical protein
MPKKNDFIDWIVRDEGCYGNAVQRDHYGEDPSIRKLPVSGKNDMEDALIEALDAGLTAEEIANIQLGATS